jgi:hypothetical protein
MGIADLKQSVPTITLRVQATFRGGFAVRDDSGKLLGASQNQMMAVWAAVTAAEEISKAGAEVRVVSTRDGKDVEEFVASPQSRQA